MRTACVVAVAALCGPVWAQDKDEVQKLRAEVRALRAEVASLKAALEETRRLTAAMAAQFTRASDLVADRQAEAERIAHLISSVDWSRSQCYEVYESVRYDDAALLQRDIQQREVNKAKGRRRTEAEWRRVGYLYDLGKSAWKDSLEAAAYAKGSPRPDPEECRQIMWRVYLAWNEIRAELGLPSAVYGKLPADSKKKIAERKAGRR